METYSVTFQPGNKTVAIEKDKTLLSAAISAGIFINSSCGGEGVCGRCKVLVKKGQVTSQSAGRVTAEEHEKGIHLACLARVQSDCLVGIPLESQLNMEGLTQEDINKRLKTDYSEPEEIEPAPQGVAEAPLSLTPLAIKAYLELPPPTLDDRVSDIERLYRAIGRVHPGNALQTSLSTLRDVGSLLRDAGWSVTATLARRDGYTEVLLIEPGDTSSRHYGVCFDIGTTTVSGQLVELTTGKVLGTKATYNKQAVFGSDVITRIVHAKDRSGLEQLRRSIVDDINAIIAQLTREHGVDLNDVTCASCAGNTTMVQLLLGIDPTHIRKEPYVPTLTSLPVLRAAEVELRINPRGVLALAPSVASYVGGDVTAGVLACGLHARTELCVLIDIGTNGEVVLGNGEFLISAAASAGPAFEGSGVSCGMRASQGAIQKVRIAPSQHTVSYEVIGAAKPAGICGSGYIDAIAELLACGIIDRGGRIQPDDSPRIRNGANGREFVLVFAKESASGSDIVITDADIDNLKRAKAAIYAALESLLRHVGLSWKDVRTVYIAGGFGTYLAIPQAIRIGLLPDLEPDRFTFIGNSSLAGARRMLLSQEAADTVQQIARRMTYLELSVEPGYMEEYMAALFFPHTDLARFPHSKEASWGR